MIEHYLDTTFTPDRTLQEQIREKLITTILSGCLPINEAMPSSRKLAKMLHVSRNTILCIYDSLIEDGFLISKKRQGYFVSPDLNAAETDISPLQSPTAGRGGIENRVIWSTRLKRRLDAQRHIVKPNNWASYEYPFIFGQVQQDRFPIEHWRNSAKTQLNSASVGTWLHDRVDRDDPELIEQLRTRILPRRGIYAQSEEIILTLGTQNSLFMIASILCDASTTVGIENPGFRDAYNIFKSHGAGISLHEVDGDGLVVNAKLHGCDYVFTTPGHQVPTGAELSKERREQLLQAASANDFVILEDDYDADISLNGAALPSLKAGDRDNRVIYMGSLSKSICPGLRMGFIVADEDLIAEIRSLRRLAYRHPPTNNQRCAAHFIGQGYYDAHLKKIRELNSLKKQVMSESIDRYLSEILLSRSESASTAFWLQAPAARNTEVLSWHAAKVSVLIEAGFIHFFGSKVPENYLRLGFSAIPIEKIVPGIQRLREVFDEQSCLH